MPPTCPCPRGGWRTPWPGLAATAPSPPHAASPESDQHTNTHAPEVSQAHWNPTSVPRPVRERCPSCLLEPRSADALFSPQIMMIETPGVLVCYICARVCYMCYMCACTLDCSSRKSRTSMFLRKRISSFSLSSRSSCHTITPTTRVNQPLQLQLGRIDTARLHIHTFSTYLDTAILYIHIVTSGRIDTSILCLHRFPTYLGVALGPDLCLPPVELLVSLGLLGA